MAVHLLARGKLLAIAKLIMNKIAAIKLANLNSGISWMLEFTAPDSEDALLIKKW